MRLHPDAISQDRAAAEWAGRIYSDDAHPTSLGPQNSRELIDERTLAGARWPGDAEDFGVPCVRKQSLEDVSRVRIAPLDQGGGSSNRSQRTGPNVGC